MPKINESNTTENNEQCDYIVLFNNSKQQVMITWQTHMTEARTLSTFVISPVFGVWFHSFVSIFMCRLCSQRLDNETAEPAFWSESESFESL